MYSFNLVNEKWIPCIMANGRLEEKSIAQVLTEPRDINEVFDGSPLVTIALHRLLLAILHRNFMGPRTEEEWKALWNGGKGNWNTVKLLAYLDKWRDRFDLFSEKYPFYQCASIPLPGADSKWKAESYELSVIGMKHELAPYLNKATLFDHTIDDSPLAVQPEEASRLLLAFQSFALGGFSLLSKPRIKGEESAKAAPLALAKGAVVLVKGKNLFETLMLNLHKYNRDDEEPFPMDADDAPAWERNETTIAVDRHPRGYLDLLTWQSRRVRFIPEVVVGGKTGVKRVVIRKGNQFPVNPTTHESISAHDIGEPMLAFHKAKEPKKGQDPWPPLSLKIDRALWRDSITMFQLVDKRDGRPKTLTWLNDLSSADVIPQSATYNIEVMGMVTDKATIDLWRHERFPLPLKFLEDQDLLSKLKDALSLAEDTGKFIGNSIWSLAKLAIAPGADRLNDLQKKAVDNFVGHLSPSRPYWARLGIVFNKLLVDLADQQKDKSQVMSGWAGEIRKSAAQAFREATDSLDRSGRWLKAITKAQDEFDHRLNILLKPYKENSEKGGE